MLKLISFGQNPLDFECAKEYACTEISEIRSKQVRKGQRGVDE